MNRVLWVVCTLPMLIPLAAGKHNFEWNAAGTASGTYFIRLTGPEGPQTRKVLLIK